MQNHEHTDLEVETDLYREDSLPFPITERDDWRHVCIQFAFKGWRHPHAIIEPGGDALTAITRSVEEQLDTILCSTEDLDSSIRMDHIRMIMERIGTLLSQVYPPKVVLKQARDKHPGSPRLYRLLKSRRIQ